MTEIITYLACLWYIFITIRPLSQMYIRTRNEEIKNRTNLS